MISYSSLREIINHVISILKQKLLMYVLIDSKHIKTIQNEATPLQFAFVKCIVMYIKQFKVEDFMRAYKTNKT